MNYPVNCPLIEKRTISEEECFDICSVVDAGAPKHTALLEAVSKEGFRDICTNCPYHKY